MTPTFTIQADSKDITAKIKDRLIQLRIVTTADDTSDYVEIELDDRDGKLALPKPGMKLEVWIGYKEDKQEKYMGLFVHDDHELNLKPQEMVIRAKASDFTAESSLKSPKTRSFDDITLCELVNQIAAEHKYTGRCSPDLADITLEHIDQTAESDLNLLRRLSKQHGATFKAAGYNLLFMPAGEGKSAKSKKDLPATTIQPGEITRGRILRKGRPQYSSVTAKYRDVEQGKTVTVRAGEGDPTFEIRELRPNREQALADAEAQYKRLKRESGALTLTLPGDPSLIAEGRIIMQDWRPGVDGTWTITRASHTLTKRGGYRCDISAEPVI